MPLWTTLIRSKLQLPWRQSPSQGFTNLQSQWRRLRFLKRNSRSPWGWHHLWVRVEISRDPCAGRPSLSIPGKEPTRPGCRGRLGPGLIPSAWLETGGTLGSPPQGCASTHCGQWREGVLLADDQLLVLMWDIAFNVTLQGREAGVCVRWVTLRMLGELTT